MTFGTKPDNFERFRIIGVVSMYIFIGSAIFARFSNYPSCFYGSINSGSSFLFRIQPSLYFLTIYFQSFWVRFVFFVVFPLILFLVFLCIASINFKFFRMSNSIFSQFISIIIRMSMFPLCTVKRMFYSPFNTFLVMARFALLSFIKFFDWFIKFAYSADHKAIVNLKVRFVK